MGTKEPVTILAAIIAILVVLLLGSWRKSSTMQIAPDPRHAPTERPLLGRNTAVLQKLTLQPGLAEPWNRASRINSHRADFANTSSNVLVEDDENAPAQFERELQPRAKRHE